MVDSKDIPEGNVHRRMEALETSNRRLSEEIARLRKVEERLRLSMHGANDGIWDWNLIDGTIYFDDRYFTMAGYEPNAFPGNFDEWEKRVHPDDIDAANRAIKSYLAGKSERFGIEFRFLRKDGRYMWIRGKGKIVARDDGGTPVRFIGTHSDITDPKLITQALRQSEEKYSKLFQDSIPIGKWFSSRSRTTATVWTRKPASAFSNRFLPPNPRGWGRAWDSVSPISSLRKTTGEK